MKYIFTLYLFLLSFSSFKLVSQILISCSKFFNNAKRSLGANVCGSNNSGYLEHNFGSIFSTFFSSVTVSPLLVFTLAWGILTSPDRQTFLCKWPLSETNLFPFILIFPRERPTYGYKFLCTASIKYEDKYRIKVNNSETINNVRT